MWCSGLLGSSWLSPWSPFGWSQDPPRAFPSLLQPTRGNSLTLSHFFIRIIINAVDMKQSEYLFIFHIIHIYYLISSTSIISSIILFFNWSPIKIIVVCYKLEVFKYLERTRDELAEYAASEHIWYHLPVNQTFCLKLVTMLSFWHFLALGVYSM